MFFKTKTIDYLPYSADITKIYLNEKQIKNIENYMEEKFAILARHDVLTGVQNLCKAYTGKGQLTAYYCKKLKEDLARSVLDIDIEREQELLAALAFIQNNESDLYIREVSMLVYGNSKYFGEECCHAVCNIIREVTGQPVDENEQYDEILQQYHISNVEQEIGIKGDFLIEIEGYRLETKYFSGGLLLSSKDIRKIKKITVGTENVMTIENKTSYCRFEKDGCSTIYLGGYANRHQIEFIKKIYFDNRNCNFLHFGDIDVGGFLIHQHLCNATGVEFQFFHMGKEDLDDVKYERALLKLSDNDILRAKKLIEKPAYQAVLHEMLEKKAKLEQEIISYTLMQKDYEDKNV